MPQPDALQFVEGNRAGRASEPKQSGCAAAPPWSFSGQHRSLGVNFTEARFDPLCYRFGAADGPEVHEEEARLFCQ